jgi:hypothetical protein
MSLTQIEVFGVAFVLAAQTTLLGPSPEIKSLQF